MRVLLIATTMVFWHFATSAKVAKSENVKPIVAKQSKKSTTATNLKPTTIKEVTLSCYFPNKEHRLTIDGCVTIQKDGSLKIERSAKRIIKFDEKDLAGGSISKKGCFWLKKSGQLNKTYCFDNGADYFSEGLARYVDAQGKFGFMDYELEIKIPPTYTFAFPFENGQSKACIGCRTVAGKGDTHSTVEGGQWMIIDKSGKVLTDCKGASKNYECKMPLKAK